MYRTVIRLMSFAAAAALVLLPAAPASAQVSAQSDLTLNLPSFVILYYFPNIDVSFDSNTLAQAFTGGTNPVSVGDATVNNAGFSPDLGISPPGTAIDPSAATLALQNAWAVRSFAASQVQVSITIDAATLSNGTDSVTMSNGRVRVGGTVGSSITFAAPGIVNYTAGDVLLDLDLTGVSSTGAYTGGQFTITAQAL